MDVKTLHGHIFTCAYCDKIHFEFNQLSIDFANLYLLSGFKSYLVQTEKRYIGSRETNQFVRKIHIPFPNTNIKMVLNTPELKELIKLIEFFLNRYSSEIEKKELQKKLSILHKKDLN